MKWIAILFALLFSACQPQVIVQAPDPAPAQAPAPAPPPAPPAWTPAIGHVYNLNAQDVIEEDYDSHDWGDRYYQLYQTVCTECDCHCMSHPDDPWHVVGGGPYE